MPAVYAASTGVSEHWYALFDPLVEEHKSTVPLCSPVWV
jgi:hypothetical protein